MTICTHRVLSPSCNCKVPSEVKQFKLWVDLFATYTYSCRICPLEFFIVFRPKNSKKNSSWQIWLLYAYVASYSTLYIMDRAWSYHNWLISTESCVNCLHNKHNIQIQPGLKAKLSLIYSRFTLRKRKKSLMLKGDNENGIKKSIRLISKKTISHVQHTFCTFLYRCFARLQLPSSRNFLVSPRFIEEMSYVFLSTFFHCRSFASFVISSPPDMKRFD